MTPIPIFFSLAYMYFYEIKTFHQSKYNLIYFRKPSFDEPLYVQIKNNNISHTTDGRVPRPVGGCVCCVLFNTFYDDMCDRPNIFKAEST